MDDKPVETSDTKKRFRTTSDRVNWTTAEEDGYVCLCFLFFIRF
jgi:hypothetical protein